MTPDGGRLSRRQLLAGAGLAAAGSLVIGPEVLAADPDYDRLLDGWAMRGHDPTRRGFATVDSGSVDRIDVAWTANLGRPSDDPSLAVVDGTVFATAERRLVALDAATGDRRWQYAHRRRSLWVETLAGGEERADHVDLIGVGDAGAYATAGTDVVALDRDGGGRRWAVRTTASVGGCVLAGTALLCAVQFDEDAIASLETGSGYSSVRVPAPELRGLAVADGRLFGVTHAGSAVLAFDPVAGTGRWRQAVPDPPPLSVPLVAAHDAVIVPGVPTVALEAAGVAGRTSRRDRFRRRPSPRTTSGSSSRTAPSTPSPRWIRTAGRCDGVALSMASPTGRRPH